MANNTANENKPTYKKWWFWLIIIVLIIGIWGTGNKKNINTSTQASNLTNSKDIVNTKNEEGQIGQYYIKIKEHNIVYNTQNKQ